MGARSGRVNNVEERAWTGRAVPIPLVLDRRMPDGMRSFAQMNARLEEEATVDGSRLKVSDIALPQKPHEKARIRGASTPAFTGYVNMRNVPSGIDVRGSRSEQQEHSYSFILPA